MMIALALGILYVSFARAGLERVSEDEKYDNLRKVTVSFGENSCYKLPETRTLPDSPFYGLKSLRDELWINLSNEPLEKARITLLIADKKIEEAIVLSKKNGKKDLIIKTSQQAAEKLKSAKDLISKMNDKDIEVQKVSQRIEMATLAYKDIIDSFKIDDKNQQGLFKLIDTCNE